jgi:hypothetical protein
MRTWGRVAAGKNIVCGCCGAFLPPDALVCALSIPNVTRPKYRCVTCAEDAPPAGLLPVLRSVPAVLIDDDGIERVVAPMTPVRALAALVDVKRRAAGEAD